MVPVTSFNGRKVAVLGLGRSGISAALSLIAGGAEVIAWDDVLEKRQEATNCNLRLIDFKVRGMLDASCLVVSPGIPLTHPQPHPVISMAKRLGLEVLGDIELFAKSVSKDRLVGITGTNGKSTVTALLGHIMSTCGINVQVGGNFGKPVLSLQAFEDPGTFVIELSSYQLDLVKTTSFDIAVWINLTPDHLDRHGGINGYIAAKKKIFERQNSGCTAIIGVDDPVSSHVASELMAVNVQNVVQISSRAPVQGGVYATRGRLYDNLQGHNVLVTDFKDTPRLLGQHNWQNAAAAYAVARLSGLEVAPIAAALHTYAGLPHRLEQVAITNGIRFINDSKATNINAASKALECYSSIYWIAGGQAKEMSVDALKHVIPRIAHVFLIGESADVFSNMLGKRVPKTISRTLDVALRQAVKKALENHTCDPVILFSPACASFDQFLNFEARGEAFHKLVRGISLESTDWGGGSTSKYKVGEKL